MPSEFFFWSICPHILVRFALNADGAPKTDGAGFIQVPHPREYGLPGSEPVPEDSQEAEIYSLSATHQLHCLVSCEFSMEVPVIFQQRDCCLGVTMLVSHCTGWY